MHELGIALAVVDEARRAAAGARVLAVSVAIGRLAAIDADALRFGWDLACQGTRLEGARLDVVVVPARARCRACGAAVEATGLADPCRCGGHDLEWLSGHELRIDSVEVSDDVRALRM